MVSFSSVAQPSPAVHTPRTSRQRWLSLSPPLAGSVPGDDGDDGDAHDGVDDREDDHDEDDHHNVVFTKGWKLAGVFW